MSFRPYWSNGGVSGLIYLTTPNEEYQYRTDEETNILVRAIFTGKQHTSEPNYESLDEEQLEIANISTDEGESEQLVETYFYTAEFRKYYKA